MHKKVKVIAGQASWVVHSDQVELAVTRLGGHMGPVKFHRRSNMPIRPYYISPWQGEGLSINEPVLVPLRGDFFCMPFGAGCDYRGKRYETHGETSGRRWTLAGVEKTGLLTTIKLTMKTSKPPGRVTKRLHLVDGQNVVYSRHVLEGFSIRVPLGHHATLAVPARPGTLLVSTSPFVFGRTNPELFGDPEDGEYQSLAIDAPFVDLKRVPLIWRRPRLGDCSALPTREGFTDLLCCACKAEVFPAWTAAVETEQRYLWFSLKDPAVLPSLLMWISNRGRHGSPWNGRNRCLGLEDVCAFFAAGLGRSVRPNALSRAGAATAVKLSPKRPTIVNYVQGVVKIPRGFGRVRTASFTPSEATFISQSGKKATAAVNVEFLRTGRI